MTKCTQMGADPESKERGRPRPRVAVLVKNWRTRASALLSSRLLHQAGRPGFLRVGNDSESSVFGVLNEPDFAGFCYSGQCSLDATTARVGGIRNSVTFPGRTVGNCSHKVRVGF